MKTALIFGSSGLVGGHLLNKLIQNNNYSKIYRCPISGLSTSGDPVVDTVFNIPAGAEDLSFNRHGDLLTVSESGANYFHDSWGIFYPFVYDIPNEVINKPSNNNLGVAYTTNTGYPFSMNVYPNPSNNHIYISYELDYGMDFDQIGKNLSLTISNLLGQQIYSENILIKDQSFLNHRINASKFSSGTYIITLITKGKKIGSEFFVNLK